MFITTKYTSSCSLIGKTQIKTSPQQLMAKLAIYELNSGLVLECSQSVRMLAEYKWVLRHTDVPGKHVTDARKPRRGQNLHLARR